MRQISVKSVMSSIIPITRFNRGEANRIFDEVAETGVKVVLKNNAPACILVDPERYESMVEALEDYALFFEAEKRLAAAAQDMPLTERDVMERFNVSDDELDRAEVELE